MDNITQLILAAPILLFSMVAHEYAHGYVAFRNGDPTAYQLGRLTFNPVKHIDPFMTILLPLILVLSHGPILGGAKPVPVNPRNYRRYKRGDIQVSLAGIVTNLVIAVLCTLMIPPLYALGHLLPAATNGIAILQTMLQYGIMINLALAEFNLIPIPPLDGSHVFKYLLHPAWALSYQRLGRYGLVLILALLFVDRSGRILDFWFAPAEYVQVRLVTLVDRYILPWPFGG